LMDDAENYAPGMEKEFYFYDFIETRPDWSFDLLGKAEGYANVSSASVFVRQASKVLDHHASTKGQESLFMYMAWQNVHGPMDMVEDQYWAESGTDKQVLAKIREIPHDTRRHFASLLVQLDNSIEAVVAKVNETLGAERTLFIYASDNGGCKDAGGFNTPLRGGKHYLFEGGVRVPAFMTGGFFSERMRGRTYHGLFHVTDWLATIMGVIETKSSTSTGDVLPAGIDSTSHWGKMVDGEWGFAEGARSEIVLNVDRWATAEDFTLYPLNFTRGAVISGDWKLILNEYENRWYAPLTLAQWQSDSNYTVGPSDDTLRPTATGSSKTTKEDCGTSHGVNFTSYLFNITADPYETNNVITEYPKIASRLQLYLETYEVHAPAYQRRMETKAVGVFEKNYRHMVPWCEVNCGEMIGPEGMAGSWSAR